MHFRARFLLIASLVITAVMVALYFWQGTWSSQTKVLPLEKLVLATPRIPFSSLLFLAKHNDLFKKHGLDVHLVVTATGKEALEMTLAGEADIAAVATLPLVYAVSRGAMPRIFAVISKSDHQHAVVARRDRGIAQPTDLKDKKIGILAGTSAQFYLEALLTYANLPRRQVRMLSITPQDSENVIVSGEVDAVALFSPWDDRVAKALGENGIVFEPSLHTTFWTLTSDVSFIDARPMAAKKLLLALMDAETLIVEQRESSFDIIAREMETSRADLDEYWKLYSFNVQLPQSLIATLERESLWLGLHGSELVGEESASPPQTDFLDYLSFSALQSVNPSAIRITR